MENQENNENTKEIKNLDELRNAAIDTLELTEDLLSEFDENLDDSTEAFEVIAEEKKEEIENLEETEPDTPKAKEQKSRDYLCYRRRDCSNYLWNNFTSSKRERGYNTQSSRCNFKRKQLSL